MHRDTVICCTLQEGFLECLQLLICKETRWLLSQLLLQGYLYADHEIQTTLNLGFQFSEVGPPMARSLPIIS